MAGKITQRDVDFFNKHGYLIIRNILTPEETTQLQTWTQEVHDWPRTKESPWMPYEEIDAFGNRVLCRTENYADYHDGFDQLLRGSRLLPILNDLAGEEMLLFKEKINYKHGGAGGFQAHIDASAYTHVKNVRHITILLAVDASNMSNGGLEVVDGSHAVDVPIGEDHCIERDWAKAQTWTPVELEAGELLIFGSYLAHRSGANKSSTSRKAIYATYNAARDGDLHKAYYEDRKQTWPATHMREEGKDYKQGAYTYGFGSPMLSLDLGKQVDVS